ncbi:MAG: hypothetical protein LBS50_08720 [Prevotellaceae bacterium]|jgi:hypothetical protein|nr:hypothetical protein [Prevotellaceae bacterium]
MITSQKYNCTVRCELITQSTIIENDGFTSISVQNLDSKGIVVNDVISLGYKDKFEIELEPYCVLNQSFKIVSTGPFSALIIKKYYTKIN